MNEKHTCKYCGMDFGPKPTDAILAGVWGGRAVLHVMECEKRVICGKQGQIAGTVVVKVKQNG